MSTLEIGLKINWKS